MPVSYLPLSYARVRPKVNRGLEVGVTTAQRTVRAGDIVIVGRAASVQFAGSAGFAFRVVEVDSRPTYDGWVWLDGFQLDRSGRVVLRRRIFVREAGLRRPLPRQA